MSEDYPPEQQTTTSELTCGWCDAQAVGRILLESGRTELDHKGRRIWIREVSAPVCGAHDASLQRRGSKVDAEARQKIAAREWRARQTAMFDARALQTGAHRDGWWRE